jgi:hypothetical protein
MIIKHTYTHYPQIWLKTSTWDHEEHQSLHTGAIVYWKLFILWNQFLNESSVFWPTFSILVSLPTNKQTNYELKNIYTHSRFINVKAGRPILPGIGTNSLGSNCLGNVDHCLSFFFWQCIVVHVPSRIR